MKAGMRKMCAKYGRLPAPGKSCGRNIRILSHCSEIVFFFFGIDATCSRLLDAVHAMQ